MPSDQHLTLYLAHRQKLVHYASGIVADSGRAEDVVQEAYLRFSAAAAERPLQQPVGFLYRIVRNLAFDLRRRRVLEDKTLDLDADVGLSDIPDRAPSPEEEAIQHQEFARVVAALEALPERTRIALEMHRFGGFTLKQIAARLGISVSMAHVLVVEGVRHSQRAL
jgi:RNA polymerase sigma-70 factor (ECF subfamily)